VFSYDALSNKLRVQVVHILRQSLGEIFYLGQLADQIDGWRYISEAIAAAHGLIELPDVEYRRGRSPSHFVACMNYILKVDTEQVLDMIGFSFKLIWDAIDNDYLAHVMGLNKTQAQTAINALNCRFRENGVGFQFEEGKIIRVDSQLLHAEVVKPALIFLSAKGFKGPNAELLAAHEHLRHNRIEPAITEACKAFESTMKVICDSRRWRYEKSKATASTSDQDTDRQRARSNL
jgi:hypothetical protein